MSSCLRNALKMRNTERFPNSPQFTFSTFSLGCQAFVFIFINSNHWLLPFLPRKTPPPARTGYHLIADQPWGCICPIFPNQPLLSTSHPTPAHPTLTASRVLPMSLHLPVAKPLIYPSHSPLHTKPRCFNGARCPP